MKSLTPVLFLLMLLPGLSVSAAERNSYNGKPVRGIAGVGKPRAGKVGTLSSKGNKKTQMKLDEAFTGEKPSKFGLATLLGYSTNLFREGEFEKSTSMSLTLAPSYKMSENWSISSGIVMTNDVSGQGDTTVNNIGISIGRTPEAIGGNLMFAPKVTGYLPTNEAAREDKRYFGGIALGGSLSTENPVLGLGIGYSFSVKKDFHEFETDNLRAENTEYAISNGLSFSRAFGDKLSLSIAGGLNTGIGYRGTLKNSFSLTETISYSINKTFSMSLGHTNAGNAFQYDGVTTNIEAFNDETSTVFFSLGIVN